MPNVALEALACGTPVIATPTTGGLTEVLEVSPTGALTIVSCGRNFHTAMSAIEPSALPHLRSSLLPDRYGLENVIESFTSLLLGMERR